MTTTPGSPPTGEESLGLPEPVLLEIEERLKAREQRREVLYERARRLRRRAQGAVHRMHRGSLPPGELAELRTELAELGGGADGGPGEDAGVVHDALQEAVEALLLGSVLSGESPPSPSELGVAPEVYLLGWGDLIGEIRRLTLRALSEGKAEEARARLELMETHCHQLLRFEAPRRIVSLKPKQDTA
ncbi:MAG: hypothetical protein ACREC5_06605, partial [Thermoplasmata archaeon]